MSPSIAGADPLEAVVAGSADLAQLHHTLDLQSPVGLHFFLDLPVDCGFPVSACSIRCSSIRCKHSFKKPMSASVGRPFAPVRRFGPPTSVVCHCRERRCQAPDGIPAASTATRWGSLQRPRRCADRYRLFQPPHGGRFELFCELPSPPALQPLQRVRDLVLKKA